MKNYFLIALCIALSGVSSAQGGQLDPSFGVNGMTSFDIGLSYSDGRSVIVQPDGKIVAIGLSMIQDNNSMISRFLPDGSFDPSFGIGGQVIFDVNPVSSKDIEYPMDLALQPDGKIIVVGAASMDENYLFDIMLLRFNPDGSVDPSFSGDGKALINLGSELDVLYTVAVQPDGKIIAAGSSGYPNGMFVIVRLHPDGALDQNFGNGGKVFRDIVPDEIDAAFDIYLQEDSKILTGGYTGDGRMALLRHLPNGLPDVSFGLQGLAAPDFDESIDQINAITISSDGRIFTAGASVLMDIDPYSDYNINLNLACFYPDGQPDLSFGTNGCMIMDVGGDYEVATGIAFMEDSKIMVGGLSDGSFFAARFNTTGALDIDFGEGGMQITTLPCFAPYRYDEGAYGMAMQVDGKVVLNGTSSRSQTTIRYDTNGSLDASFGENGVVQINSYPQYSIDDAKDMIIQADGKIVIAGNAKIAEYGDGEVAIARLLPDGTRDESFGKNGVVTTDFLSRVNAAIITQNNNILVAVSPGYYDEYPGADVLIRYKPDGSLDNTFGTSGLLALNAPNNYTSIGAKVMIEQPGGKIVVASSTSEGLSASRLLQNGSLDNTFGTNGTSLFYWPANQYGSLYSIVQQPDGKLLLGGGNKDLILFRCSTDGILDASFGDNGIVIQDFGSSYSEYIQDLAVQADGKIIVAAFNGTYPAKWMIGQYLPNGSPDNDFGVSGWIVMDAYYGDAFSIRVDIQQDGKIVLSGRKSYASLFLTRLLYNGQPDISFGVEGTVTFSGSGSSQYNDKNICDLQIQPDNKIVIAGYTRGMSSNHDFLVARFLPGTVISTQEPAGPIETMAIYGGPASRYAFLAFRLSESSEVTVDIYNLNGQCVHTPVADTPYSAGEHRLLLNIDDLPPGPYFITLSGDHGRRTVKMIR